MNCTWSDTRGKNKAFVCGDPSLRPGDFAVYFENKTQIELVVNCIRKPEKERYHCFNNETEFICSEGFSSIKNCTSPKIWVTDNFKTKFGMFRCQTSSRDTASATICEWPIKEVEMSGNMTNSNSGNSTISTDTDGTLGVGPICGISAVGIVILAIVAGLVIGYKKKWKTNSKTDGKVSVQKDKDCEAGKHVGVSKDLLEREETWEEGFSSPIQSPYVKLREKICYMPVPVAHSVHNEFSPVAHPVDDEFSPVAHPVDDEFSPVAHPVDDVPSSVAHPMDDEDSYDHSVNELG